MDKKHLYQTPTIIIYQVEIHDPLLELSSAQATYISNPGVGDAETGDVVGTESRRGGDGFWDE